jgi:hypothetical protein
MHGWCMADMISPCGWDKENQSNAVAAWVACLFLCVLMMGFIEKSTKMSHRQSGGYKEEPGVAVGGDHVSTQLFTQLL